MAPPPTKGAQNSAFEKAIQTLTVLGCDERGNPPGGLRLLKEDVNIVTPDGKKVVLVWPGLSWDGQVRGDLATSATDEPKNQYITEVITGGGDKTDDPHLWGTLDPFTEPPAPTMQPVAGDDDEDEDNSADEDEAEKFELVYPEWPTLVWRPMDVAKLRKALGNMMQQQTRLEKAHKIINEERASIHENLIKKKKLEEAGDFEPLPYTSKYARWQRDVIDPDSNKSTFVEVTVLSDNVWQARESAPKRDRSAGAKKDTSKKNVNTEGDKDEETTSCTFMNAKGQGALFEEMEGLDNGVAPKSTKGAPKTKKTRIITDSSDSESEEIRTPPPVQQSKKPAAAAKTPGAAAAKPPGASAAKPPGAAKGKTPAPAASKKRSAASVDDTTTEMGDIETFVGFYQTIKRRREETGNDPITPFIYGGWPADGFGPDAWNKIAKGENGKERVRLMMASLQMCAIGDTMTQVHTPPTCMSTTSHAF